MMRALVLAVSLALFGALSASVAVAQDMAQGARPLPGIWALNGDKCGAATNWTLGEDGSFASEELSGTWQVEGSELTLKLIDHHIDEETGEEGGRFELRGPFGREGDAVTLTVEPEIYRLTPC